ncbi:MAG: APC family permease [Gaiellales bacterium]
MATEHIGREDLITSAALEEKTKLRRHFGRFDIFFFLLCTIVGVDTLGQVAAEGAQGFLWLIFLCIFFFIPYGLLVAELGAAFPEEGGAYIWTRMAWGRLVAGVNAIFYWFSNPVWIGATLALLAIAAIQNYIWHFDDNSIAFWIVGLVYIWFSVWSAILSFGVGKWIPTLGAFCRIILIGFFSLTTIIYAIQNGLHFPALGEFSPTWTAFIALTPLLFFNLVGFELPSAAGDEMKNPKKDVPYTVLRAIIVSILLYGLPILAMICVIPPEQLKGKGVSSFLDAVDTVFGVYGSASGVMIKVAAVMFVLAAVSSASTWLMGSDRAQAIASIDGTGPSWLGRFSSRYGTPLNVNLISGILSTLVFIVAVKISTGSAADAFNVMIGIVLLFTTLSFIVIFPAVIKLRYSHAHVDRPYRIPGGMVGVWICGGLTTFWAVLASISGIFPGFLVDGKILDDAQLPEAVTRSQYTTYAFIAIGVTIIVGFIFYWVGTPARRKLVQDPEVDLGGTAPAGD